jgi:hypothetical protein
MRRYVAAGLVVAGVLATGCRVRLFQVSVHPFFHTTDAPGDLGGRWVSEENEAEGLDLAPAGENEWRVDIFDAKAGLEGQKPSGGVVRFGRVGGALYWDMTVEGADATGDLAKEHLLELHSVARVRWDGDTMELAFLDPRWMSEALADGRVDLAHFGEGEDDGDHSIILTARTEELEVFLQAYGDVPEAFSEPEVYHRVP